MALTPTEAPKPITGSLFAEQSSDQSKTERSFTDDERVQSMVQEYQDWESKMEEYRADMRIDEELFQGYNRDAPDQIPTNTGASIIESFVARAMDANWKVTSKVKGFNGMVNRKIQQTLHNVAEDIRDDAQIAEIHGTYDSQKEMALRDFFVVGNFVGTVEYEYLEGEEGHCLADGAYFNYEPWDRYTFNPSFTWETSPVKYLRKWCSMQSLEENALEEYEEEETEDIDVVLDNGQVAQTQVTRKVKKTRGKWDNLDALRETASQSGKVTQRVLSSDTGGTTGFFTPAGGAVSEYVEDIELLIRTEGAWITIIADRKHIIYEEYDPYGLGCDNFIVGMNYKFKNRPFAYGEMALARGIIKLKDQAFNQRAAVIERALKVGVLINDPNADTDVITNVLINGGVAKGNASSVNVLNAVNLPQNAFLMGNEYQQELERVLRYSAYAAGMPNQTTDKTNGTKGGILAIQAAAEPNFNIKLRIIQERLDTPFLRKSLKMVASQSDDDDFRWVLRSGMSNEYSRISKRFMTGRPLLTDLVAAGIIAEEDLQKYTHTKLQDGTVAEIPGALEAPYVSQDWALGVTLDPKTAADRFQEAQTTLTLLEKAEEKGQPVDWEKALPDLAAKMGEDELEQYFLSPEVVAQRQAQQQQMMMQKQQAEQAAAAASHQQEMTKMTAQQQHEIKLKEMELAAQAQGQSPQGVPTAQPAPAFPAIA